MSVMRSVFYVPGNREDLIAKMPKLPVDVITLDLEDSVPPAEKEKARQLSHQSLQLAAFSGADVYVRVNSWETNMTSHDCEAVVEEGLTGVCLPKCTGPDDIRRLDWELERIELRKGIELGAIRIQILIESAKGMMNIYESANASKRVSSIVFGAGDYTVDMGIALVQPVGEGLRWARALVACAAKAANVLPIDSPYVAYEDIQGFEEDTLYSQQLGFDGRLLLAPRQIESCHRIYTPAPDRVQWAKETVKVFEEEGIAKGVGSLVHKGQVIDTVTYVQATRLLQEMDEIESREGKRATKKDS